MNSGFNIFIIILFVLITLVILLNIQNIQNIQNTSQFGSTAGFTGQCGIDCTNVDTSYDILLMGIDTAHHLLIAGYSTIGNKVSPWESYDNTVTLNSLYNRKNGVFVGSSTLNKFSIGIAPNNMYTFDETFDIGGYTGLGGITGIYKGDTVTPLDITEIDDNTLVCINSTNNTICESYSPALPVLDTIFWNSISANDKSYISISNSYDNTHLLCVDNKNILYSVNYPIQQGQEIVTLGNQKLLKVILLSDKKILLGVGADYKLYSNNFNDDYTSISSSWTLLDGNVQLLSITAIENL